MPPSAQRAPGVLEQPAPHQESTAEESQPVHTGPRPSVRATSAGSMVLRYHRDGQEGRVVPLQPKVDDPSQPMDLVVAQAPGRAAGTLMDENSRARSETGPSNEWLFSKKLAFFSQISPVRLSVTVPLLLSVKRGSGQATPVVRRIAAHLEGGGGDQDHVVSP